MCCRVVTVIPRCLCSTPALVRTRCVQWGYRHRGIWCRDQPEQPQRSGGAGHYNHPALIIHDGAGSVLLDYALSGQTYQFNFNGGSTLSLAQFLAQVHVTTSSVAGASGNTILEGTASTAVTGGTGNDTLYAAAASDTIRGGSGHPAARRVGRQRFRRRWRRQRYAHGAGGERYAGGPVPRWTRSSAVRARRCSSWSIAPAMWSNCKRAPGADTVSASAWRILGEQRRHLDPDQHGRPQGHGQQRCGYADVQYRGRYLGRR